LIFFAILGCDADYVVTLHVPANHWSWPPAEP